MRRRAGFATRLTIAGMALTVALVGGVSAFLLVSGSQQTTANAQNNADNRSAVVGQLLTRLTAPQVVFAAADVQARLSARLTATGGLDGTALDAAVTRIVTAAGVSEQSDFTILDRAGDRSLYTFTTATEVDQTPPPDASIAAVAAALHGGAVPSCGVSVPNQTNRQHPATTDACGIDLLTNGQPAYIAASALTLPSTVFSSTPAAPSGTGCTDPTGSKHRYCAAVIVAWTPLVDALGQYSPVVGYPTTFVPLSGQGVVVRYAEDKIQAGQPVSIRTTTGHVPTSIFSAMTQHPRLTTDASQLEVSGVYSVDGVGPVAASYFPVSGTTGETIAGYLGVEVPLSDFQGQTDNEIKAILAIGGTALLVVLAAVFAFVERFVRRPVLRLERGVGRIADGDYSTPITVTSDDELGRLGRGVNRMRGQIANYVRYLDSSVTQLREVSRALTTTTAGLDALQDAVLAATVAIAGEGASASLLSLANGGLRQRRATPGMIALPTLSSSQLQALDRGDVVRDVVDDTYLLVIPMLYQQRLRGALAVARSTIVPETGERALGALAYNAGVALENTRLFEQERATVQRLRELDAMKSDFLTTAQHELRTPILAIMGQIELIGIAWSQWDKAAKLDVLRDIEISTRMLSDLVETVVDFSLLSAETIDLRRKSVAVQPVVEAALAGLGQHFKSGLPVTVAVHVDAGLCVDADEQRFRQVIRAILDNAVKFTAGGGSVTIAAHGDGNVVRIAIADTGIGIGREALRHIFERFYQEDTSKTRAYGGLGMGLALVRRLCDAHGSTATAESTVGAGTTIALVWPRAAEAPVVSHSAGFHLTM